MKKSLCIFGFITKKQILYLDLLQINAILYLDLLQKYYLCSINIVVMFKRNAIDCLEKWKIKENRKPLIIRGARQVGKTSLVKEFAKQFDDFLYFNLELADDLALFSKEVSVTTLYEMMLVVRHKTKSDGNTLIFIDEIQNSSLAIKMLRYFYEEMSHLYVIAAGSLLETMINKEVSFPVGRVEYMALRPCTFDEFLGAMGEDALRDMVRHFSVPEPLHERVMSLFNTYALVGGMPQAVSDYSSNRDIVALDSVFTSLLTSYIDDVEKYKTSDTSRNVLRYIISHGWNYASERITFERFANSNYKSREVGDAFRTLQKTMLLELVYPTTETKLPILPDLKKKPKLLWLDTGLLNYAVGIQSEIIGKENINDAWRGKIAEHVVGQAILGQSNNFLDVRSFWVREAKNSQAELDYLYSNRKYGLLPIEVKSGLNTHLKSLQLFMLQSPCSTAVRFWSNHYSVDEIALDNKSYKLHNMPYYYSGYLEEFMERL